MIKKIKEFKWGYILLFFSILAIGLAFIVFGEDATKKLALAIGIIIITFGVIFIALTLAGKDRGFNFWVKTIIGICLIISGAVTVISDQSIGFIISLFGLFLIMDGAFKLQTAASSKRYGVGAWWLIMILAVLIAAGGYVVLYTAKESVANDTLGLTIKLSGFTMIIDAFANMLSAFFISAYEKRMFERRAVEAPHATKEDGKDDSDEA